MALPLLHAADMLSFGLLLAIVAAIGAFMPPYAASQRVILPELVGEDVTTMSQANSLIEGGTAAAALIGPRSRASSSRSSARRTSSTSTRLRTSSRSCSCSCSCRGRSRCEAAPTGGLFEGVRFVARDAFMGSLVGTIVVFGFFSSALSAALPAYVFFEGDGRAWPGSSTARSARAR